MDKDMMKKKEKDIEDIVYCNICGHTHRWHVVNNVGGFDHICKKCGNIVFTGISPATCNVCRNYLVKSDGR